MTFLTAQARLDFSLRTTPLSNEEIRQLLTLSRDNTYVSKNRSEPGNYLVSMGESQKYETIVGYFADIITSRFDQDVSLLLVGNKGSGKSRAALSLCYFGACELVERLGGHWTDYFDPEVNMAVISPERAREVMNIKQKYAIKNFDDVGLAWGARNWQKKENIEKGEVFQISRIDNQLQIFSIPNQFLLDKVPRSLVSHYAEMDKSFFEYGFTTLKLFKPLTLFREGKILQPYLSVNKTKYVLYRIPRPPKFLDDIYTKIRREATTEAMKSRLEAKKDMNDPSSYRGNCALLNTKGPELRKYGHIPEIIRKHRPEILDLLSQNKTRREIVDHLHKNEGYPKDYINRWYREGKFAREGINFPS